MQTTLKRIDVSSAFRVGVVLYALIFAVFGLLFVAMQGLFWSAISRSAAFDQANEVNMFFGAGILSLLCFYIIGIVVGAIFGGIQCAIFAWLYNLTSNWVGGLKVELETADTGLLDDLVRETEKRKRSEPEV
jgi:hypothetical protein